MKVILFLILSFSFLAQAQKASLKDIPADVDGETTISISKGTKAQAEFQISDGSAEVEGDPEILVIAARSSWKKACEQWKTELKELNKENQNQVLAISCNSPTCVKNETSATICKSQATYKIKTRIK